MSPGKILAKYRETLGDDYHAYINHVKRVYEYSCILRLTKSNDLLQIAAIFHDLDIWQNDTMDYLPGSIEIAKQYVADQKLDLDSDQLESIIRLHHKMTPIKNNPLAEAFRKADLIDLTSGLIHFNIPKSLIVDTERRYPRLGFTKMIMKKTIRWAFRHPLRPLPMMKL